MVASAVCEEPQAVGRAIDAAERVLDPRPPGQADQGLRDLVPEEDRLEAEAFVQKAMDV